MRVLQAAPPDPGVNDILVVPHVATTHSQLCRYYGRVKAVNNDMLDYEVVKPRMTARISRTGYRCIYFTGIDYVWSRPNDILHWVVKIPGFRDVPEPAATAAKAISQALTQYGESLVGKVAKNRQVSAAERALEQLLHKPWDQIKLQADLDLKVEPFVLRRAA